MVIFWILFVWLPLAIYALQFWELNVRDFDIEFNIMDELLVLFVLFLMPAYSVIIFCILLDYVIEKYIWGKK